MDKYSKRKIKDKEYSSLITFKYKENNYIVYTDFQKNDNGNVSVYYSMYNEKEDGLELSQVTDKNDAEYIENYIQAYLSGVGQI